jgi:hypothetical protein
MPSAAKSYFSHAIVKPFVAGAVAAAADHYFMKNPHLKENAIFGGAVGAGIFLASNVEQAISPLFPTATSLGVVNGVVRNLEGRVVEIACGSAAVLAINKFVLGKADYDMKQWMVRGAIIAAADVAGDTICTLMMIV